MRPARLHVAAAIAALVAGSLTTAACIGIVGDFPVANLQDASAGDSATSDDRAMVADSDHRADGAADVVDAGIDAPPPTCGVPGLPCCDGGCGAGAACRDLTDSGTAKCVACGGATQECCDGPTCDVDAGLRCLDIPPKCLSCVPEGGVCSATTGADCCPGTVCDPTTSTHCVPCGGLNQPCCGSTSPPCGSDAGLHCCTSGSSPGICFLDMDPQHCGPSCAQCQFSNGCCPTAGMYACVNTQNDPANCHACGQVCDSGICTSGSCQ